MEHNTPASFQVLKLTLFNGGAWLATIFTWAHFSEILTTLSALAAVSVSTASFLWIRKQSKAFDEDRGRKLHRQDVRDVERARSGLDELGE